VGPASPADGADRGASLDELFVSPSRSWIRSGGRTRPSEGLAHGGSGSNGVVQGADGLGGRLGWRTPDPRSEVRTTAGPATRCWRNRAAHYGPGRLAVRWSGGRRSSRARRPRLTGLRTIVLEHLGRPCRCADLERDQVVGASRLAGPTSSAPVAASADKTRSGGTTDEPRRGGGHAKHLGDVRAVAGAEVGRPDDRVLSHVVRVAAGDQSAGRGEHFVAHPRHESMSCSTRRIASPPGQDREELADDRRLVLSRPEAGSSSRATGPGRPARGRARPTEPDRSGGRRRLIATSGARLVRRAPR